MTANVPVIILDDEDDGDVQITGVATRRVAKSGCGSLSSQIPESVVLGHGSAAGPVFGSPLQTGATRKETNYMSPRSFDWLVEETYGPDCQEFHEAPGMTAPVTRTPERVLPPTAMPHGQPAMSNESNRSPHPSAQEQRTGSRNAAATPFTAKFYKDMVDKIASIFPYQEFAASHGCSAEDVNRALMGTVLGPLVGDSSPIGTHVETDFGSQIKKWDTDYQDMAHVLQAEREASGLQGDRKRAAAAEPHAKDFENVDNAAIDANPMPAVDPQLVDPQLTNGAHHIPPASAGPNPQSATGTDETSYSRKRSRSRPETTPIASSGRPTEPLLMSSSKKTKKRPTTTRTTFLDPPIAALADRLANSISEHLAAVSAAQGDRRPPHAQGDSRLRYPEISRRKPVVVDAFGSYVKAPDDRGSLPDYYPHCDEGEDSSSRRLPRLPTPGPK